MLTNLFKIIQKSFVRLRTAAMNPFRRVVRRIQQMFNVNLITAKLITPINKKIRSILSVKPKTKSDYISIGFFWISRKLIYFLILAGCAAVFIYFSWFASPIEDKVEASNVATTIYYDYDDLDLVEFSGKANIRSANGQVVYTGDIVSGLCTGVGTVWNQDGVLVYQGTLENNHYSGEGTLYYPNGKAKYTGSFSNNVYAGFGTSYYEDGTTAYVGEFQNGYYSGEGILYDEKGIMVYAGMFENGNYNGTGVSYYTNGVKKYEGEFYVGYEQGQGILYSTTGKQLFTGAFLRGQIQYESLLDASMEDVLSMCSETPRVYYSDSSTVFLFEGIGVALEANCVVELQKNESQSNGDDGWYLPNQDDTEILQDTGDDTVAVDLRTDAERQTDALEGLNDSVAAGNPSKTGEGSGDSNGNGNTVDLPVISTAGQYDAYYYLDSDEWQKEADLDYSQIQVTRVSVMNSEFSTDLFRDLTAISDNGEAGLLECVSIDQLRLAEPTLFGNISFTQTARSKRYIRISGIDYASAIYTESYDIEHIRYRLCYQADEYENWSFVTMESY